MAIQTTEGHGNGSATNSLPLIINGVVKAVNLPADSIADNVVTTAKINALAVTTAKINALAVTTAKIAANAVSVAKMQVFKSAELTGTGAAQNAAHGLGVIPGLVMIFPTNLSGGVYVLVEGTHTITNVVVTVTSGEKFMVVAFV